MSRVRTGHGPMDWSDNDGGAAARPSASAFIAGQMVQPEPHRKITLIRPTTADARCNQVGRQHGEPCVRAWGHTGWHRRSRAKEAA